MILPRTTEEKVKLVKILFIFLFWLLPLGQLERLPLGIAGVGVYLHEIVLAVLVGFWFWDVVSNKKKVAFSKLGRVILAVLVVFILSWIVNIYRWKKESLFGFLYIVRWGMYACLYFITSYYSKLDKKLVPFIRRGVLLSGFLFVVLGIFQYLFLPDLRWLIYFGWDDHYYRLTGTLLDPSYTGLFLTILTIYLLKEVEQKNLFYYLYLSLVLIGLSLTYSRSSYLAFFIGVFLLIWNKKRFIRSFLLGAVLLFILFLTLLLLPKPGGEGVNLIRTSTIYSRIASYRQGLVIFRQNPILGVGFNNYRIASKEFGFLKENWRAHHAGAGVENSFLLILATTGIVGGVVFLGFVLVYAQEKKKLHLVLPIITHSLFNNSLFYPWIMLLWWLLL